MRTCSMPREPQMRTLSLLAQQKQWEKLLKEGVNVFSLGQSKVAHNNSLGESAADENSTAKAEHERFR
uniref:Uncharacterized protein n=1 Tax=Parascaris equorum TaxID=6256 RepID=A0A914RY97_PAREQ